MVSSRHKPDAGSRGGRGAGRSSSGSAPPQTASSGAAIDPSLNSAVTGLPQPPAYNPLVSAGASGARANTTRRGSRTSADPGGSAHGTDPSRHAAGGSDLPLGGSNGPVSNRRGSGNMGTTSGSGNGSDRPRSRSGRGASFRGGDGGDGGGRGEGSNRPSSRAGRGGGGDRSVGTARGGSEDLEGGGGGGSRHDGRGAGGGGGGESGSTRVPYQNRVGMECLSPINVARDTPFGASGEYGSYCNVGAVQSALRAL